MKQKKKKIIYQWHPILQRILDNENFKRILTQVPPSVRSNPKICNFQVLFTPASIQSKESELECRLICSPLLGVGLWSDQNVLIKNSHPIKCSLSETDVEQMIVAELIRLMSFSTTPFLCENIRRLINQTISESVRVSYFSQRKLSQTKFGELVGLSRTQMAHGSAGKKKDRAKKKESDPKAPININFFNMV